jgi:DNA-binding transcriptional regulator LsrR (DeoR family)
LERIETEISAGGQGEFAAAEMEAITDRHGAGAIAFNGFDDNGQVIKLKLIGVHGIVRS